MFRYRKFTPHYIIYIVLYCILYFLQLICFFIKIYLKQYLIVTVAYAFYESSVFGAMRWGPWPGHVPTT